MDLDVVQRNPPAGSDEPGAKPADLFLDAGIDVGAIESGDAGIDKSDHVGNRLIRIHRAMVAGKLPATLDDRRDEIGGPNRDSGDLRHAARTCAVFQIASHIPVLLPSFRKPIGNPVRLKRDCDPDVKRDIKMSIRQ